MVAQPCHLQAYGIVHGGVYAGIIESLASVGAAIHALAEGKSVVGLENHTSFLRAVRSGTLHGVAKPLTRGRRSPVWECSRPRSSVARNSARSRAPEPGSPAQLGGGLRSPSPGLTHGEIEWLTNGKAISSGAHRSARDEGGSRMLAPTNHEGRRVASCESRPAALGHRDRGEDEIDPVDCASGRSLGLGESSGPAAIIASCQRSL